MTLLKHGVNVALGVTSEYDVRNARFEIAWVSPRRLRAFIISAEIFYNTQAALDADGAIDYTTAMALATTNMDRALGLHSAPADQELVILKSGGLFDFESKVLGVISGRRELVDLF